MGYRKMLKIIRQHAKSPFIKIILYAVVLSFIATIFLIWGRGKGGIEDNPYVVATIEGEDISTQEFLRVYRSQLSSQKESLTQSIDDSFIKQLVGSQTLSLLINRQIMLSEANKRSIKISPQEIMEYITDNYPVFQENGKFVGFDRYREILQASRITEAEFENNIRNELMIQKFQMFLISNIFISSEELWEEYKNENEKIKIDYVLVSNADYIEEVKATPEELQSYFKENKDDYQIAEKRKIEYVIVEKEALKLNIQITKKEINRYYEQHKNLYLVPEERRASHILIKLSENASPEIAEQARKKAEEIYKKSQAGEDFTQLAQKYSEDEATANEGGDLGFFPRGRMVAEFDSEAFSMSIGQISPPVKSQFGFHIIRLTDIRKPHFKSPDDIEVQSKIKKELIEKKSQQEAENISKKISQLAKDKGGLSEAAKSCSLEAKKSEFFSQEEGIAEIPSSYQIAEKSFELKANQISSPIPLSNGFSIIKLLEKKDPYMPELSEVKELVEEDFKAEGSKRIALQKINSIKEKLSSAELLEQLAKENQLEVKSTDLFNREQYLPQLGRDPFLFKEAFSLKPHQISQVISLDKGYCLFRVAEKQEADRSEFLLQKDELKRQLLSEKQMEFLSGIIAHLREQKKININAELYNRLIS